MKRLVLILLVAMMVLVGCESKEKNDPSSTGNLTDSDTYYYKNIDDFSDSTTFSTTSVGEFDLTKSPKEWISEAFDKYSLTAGLGGNNEKESVTDLDTLLSTEIEYRKNFEIYFNNDSESRITCTNFYSPYDNGKKVTVEDCINIGWWKAYNIVTLNETATVEEIIAIFGKPTSASMRDEDSNKTILFGSVSDFVSNADKALNEKEEVEYNLVWTDGVKYMVSPVIENNFNHSVMTPYLFGKDYFTYDILGENVDVSSVDTTTTDSSTEQNTVNSDIDQDVFEGNNGDFTTVTIKSEYRNNYFVMNLPSEFKFSSMSSYPDYTIKKYAGENLQDDIVYLDTDNDFMASYDGVQNADDTNTERLARKHPDGMWVESNGLKAYVFEDGHIFVSIDNEENTNLLVSFYGNTNKYTLEEYAKYILSLVTLVK